MTAGQINTLIVDDSAVVRQVLTAMLQRDARINVIGAAADPIFAMERMNQQWPDVVVLDVEMPRMDGITFLKKIMAVRPTPVVLCSSLTEAGAEMAVRGMNAGAVSFVTKPKNGLKNFLEGEASSIAAAVREAASANMRRHGAVTSSLHESARLAPPRDTGTGVAEAMAVTTEHLVAIGTSTGGTQALEVVLTALPRVSPGIVVVQHMPEKFTAAFAQRLNGLSQIEVREAADGDRVMPGLVLIAPGGKHTSLVRHGAQYRVQVKPGPPVNRHCPSVDVLFRSVAKSAGANALGVIMTGMGDDGARGLHEMRQAGARTIGQDERTCVVYGMPKVAADMGAVEREVPLASIAGLIHDYGATR
ncbi:protein-glutamate methylesterase/protein-glutamine glutaminase [Mangrovihabitans endophyticus]|uniref:Protein-glutamate methylesterase/protein-glutamine glutaminase n=1 Tax=Mangrovihabitans endophyticus TaxID=1751298 RepID=A0A8J3C2W7_9ACTN|nr:chemotaxis response regulator protein-glutamate methylesterase [Mangrovihabitans endophyticus]GGL07460.1 chemotaxis response regulator protein-glutamate methylesterase 1 [Mangrovihabitans endophyticus]